MSIKITLQYEAWDTFLRKEAREGNEEAIASLDWMKTNRWLRPKPFLQDVKPKIEV